MPGMNPSTPTARKTIPTRRAAFWTSVRPLARLPLCEVVDMEISCDGAGKLSSPGVPALVDHKPRLSSTPQNGPHQPEHLGRAHAAVQQRLQHGAELLT